MTQNGESPAVQQLHVQVDRFACDCVGYCQNVCPQVFRVNYEAGHSEVLMPIITDVALFPSVEEAAEICPTSAILVEVRWSS